MEQLAVRFIAGIRCCRGKAAAAGAATNAVVIRVGEVSRSEVQQEMRRWHRAYGETEAVPLFCTHLVVCGRPQTRAVPSSDNHTSLDWSGPNHQRFCF